MKGATLVTNSTGPSLELLHAIDYHLLRAQHGNDNYEELLKDTLIFVDDMDNRRIDYLFHINKFLTEMNAIRMHSYAEHGIPVKECWGNYRYVDIARYVICGKLSYSHFSERGIAYTSRVIEKSKNVFYDVDETDRIPLSWLTMNAEELKIMFDDTCKAIVAEEAGTEEQIQQRLKITDRLRALYVEQLDLEAQLKSCIKRKHPRSTDAV